jgi:antitoxin (DNA-binding transcriptional repressor) of toxin-antitoxin stability system
MSTTYLEPKMISMKDFRLNTEEVEREVAKGRVFTILKRSKPIFRISLPEDEWEFDFTDSKNPRGIKGSEMISALKKSLKDN